MIKVLKELLFSKQRVENWQKIYDEENFTHFSLVTSSLASVNSTNYVCVCGQVSSDPSCK